jgi:hypothetical protein
MKSMIFWAGLGSVVGFLALWVVFVIVVQPRGPDGAVFFVFSIMGAIPATAIGAIFAGVNFIQKEMRETRRELKHWQSIQQLDVDLDKPSIHIKPAPPSGGS